MVTTRIPQPAAAGPSRPAPARRLPWAPILLVIVSLMLVADLTLRRAVTPGPGTLLVESVPTGATVVMNGNRYTTPFSVSLPAGHYSLTVHKDGFQEIEESVELKPGRDFNLRSRLVPAAP